MITNVHQFPPVWHVHQCLRWNRVGLERTDSRRKSLLQVRTEFLLQCFLNENRLFQEGERNQMPKGHSLKRNLNMFILFTVYPIIDIMILIQEHIMHTSLCLEINIYPATQTYQIGILLKLSYPFISFFSSSYLTLVQPGKKNLHTMHYVKVAMGKWT